MDKKDMPRRREAMELRIRRTMAALEKNNMSAYYAPESADLVRRKKIDRIIRSEERRVGKEC